MEFLATLDTKPQMSVEAPPTVATNIAVVNGKPTIFCRKFYWPGATQDRGAHIANRRANLNARCGPQNSPRSSLPGRNTNRPGQRIGDRLVFKLPTLERGAVVWFEDTESIH